MPIGEGDVDRVDPVRGVLHVRPSEGRLVVRHHQVDGGGPVDVVRRPGHQRPIVTATEEQVQPVFGREVDRVGIGIPAPYGKVGRQSLLRTELADVFRSDGDAVEHLQAGVFGVEHCDSAVGQHDQARCRVIIGIEVRMQSRLYQRRSSSILRDHVDVARRGHISDVGPVVNAHVMHCPRILEPGPCPVRDHLAVMNGRRRRCGRIRHVHECRHQNAKQPDKSRGSPDYPTRARDHARPSHKSIKKTHLRTSSPRPAIHSRPGNNVHNLQ